MEANATVSESPITRKPYWRTLLILGRVSNLPTVWSNCLAGWILAGGGLWERFFLLSSGASLLYLGGMYLNDAFDAEFDRQHRADRPIPSGAIRRADVWILGILWLLSGLGCIAILVFHPPHEAGVPNPLKTGLLAILLVVSIFVYDAVHKALTLSPVLMAACRFFLILLAASTGDIGITGLSIWTALVMASYIVGLSYIARQESIFTVLRYWPCIFMAAPVVLAFVVDRGEWRARGLVLSTLFLIWTAQALIHAYWLANKNIGLCVSRLLAGIVLVDLLSVANAGPGMLFAFAALFLLALLFQHFVPAT